MTWLEDPFRLVSLRQMIPFSFSTFGHVIRSMTEMGAECYEPDPRAFHHADGRSFYDEPLPEEVRNTGRAFFTAVLEELEPFRMPVSKSRLKRLIEEFDDPSFTGKGQMKILRDLPRTMHEEIDGYMFFYLPSERVGFYAQGPDDLFGAHVCASFPSVADDLEEAAKCYALGRGTACVFHLMRVGEGVAEAVARSLGVIVPPNPRPNETGWGFFAKETGKRIAEYSANKNVAPPDWAAKSAFYSEVHADLLALNKAWRNPTMHMEKTYALDRAKQIMDATKAFVGHIAAHLDEQGTYTP